MTETLTQMAFSAASLPKGWSLRGIERAAPTNHTDSAAAIAEFRAGFEPEYVLATFQSGVLCLSAGQDLPDDLGEPLHLEGVQGRETRILRHVSGTTWRSVRLLETDEATHVAETVRWLGPGAAGEGQVGELTYRRYWQVAEDGGMRAKAARLMGVTPVSSGGEEA